MTERGYKAEIERHLWAAIDLMAATLEKPDPRVWEHLLVYVPKDDIDGESTKERP
jgi:hypothetical protein